MAAFASMVPKATLLRLGIIGGVSLYVAFKFLYNVEGGHRAIVFNRIHGIKDRVNLSRHKVYSSLSNSILLKAVSVSN